MKDGNKNRLRGQDIHKIADVFNKQIKVPKYSRFVPYEEIADQKNDYNQVQAEWGPPPNLLKYLR